MIDSYNTPTNFIEVGTRVVTDVIGQESRSGVVVVSPTGPSLMARLYTVRFDNGEHDHFLRKEIKVVAA